MDTLYNLFKFALNLTLPLSTTLIQGCGYHFQPNITPAPWATEFYVLSICDRLSKKLEVFPIILSWKKRSSKRECNFIFLFAVAFWIEDDDCQFGKHVASSLVQNHAPAITVGFLYFIFFQGLHFPFICFPFHFMLFLRYQIGRPLFFSASV